MVFLTRHEESIKARLCFAFSINSFFQSWILFQSISYNPLQALKFFELLLLPFAKSFPKFAGFPNLENLCYSSFSFPSPFAKKDSPRTNRLDSFSASLFPWPKEKRTNRLNSFVSPFFLVKELKMTQSENSFYSSLSLIQKCSKD